MDRDTALKLAESRRSELLALLSELISTPSLYGSSSAKAQQVVAGYLRRYGFSVELSTDDPESYRDHPEFTQPLPFGKEAPVNLVARPDNLTAAPLALYAHVDTEEPGQGWHSNPTEPLVHDGRMYGLGTADDKGGLAAVLVAAAALYQTNGEAPLVISIHGKGGGARGTLPVMTTLKGLSACVYIHPPETGYGMRVLENASRGVVDVTLEIKGWRGSPREGVMESAPFSEGGDALKACLAIVHGLRQGELSQCEINLGKVVAGDSAGLVPDRCHAELRVLFEDPLTVPCVLAAITAELERSAPRFESQILESTVSANPGVTSWEDPACVILREAVGEITGVQPDPYTNSLASDTRFPNRMHNIAAVGIGSNGGNFYAADEWVDIDDLVQLVAVLMLFVSKWHARDGASR